MARTNKTFSQLMREYEEEKKNAPRIPQKQAVEPYRAAQQEQERQIAYNQGAISRATAQNQAEYNGGKELKTYGLSDDTDNPSSRYLTKKQKKKAEEEEKAKKQEEQKKYDQIEFFRNQKKQDIINRYKSDQTSVSKDEIEYYFDMRLDYPEHKYEQSGSEYFKQKNINESVDKVKAMRDEDGKDLTFPKNFSMDEIKGNEAYKDAYSINKDIRRLTSKEVEEARNSGSETTLVRNKKGEIVPMATEELEKGKPSFWNKFFGTLEGLGQGSLAYQEGMVDETNINLGELLSPLKADKSEDVNNQNEGRLKRGLLSAGIGLSNQIPGLGAIAKVPLASELAKNEKELFDLNKKKRSGDWEETNIKERFGESLDELQRMSTDPKTLNVINPLAHARSTKEVPSAVWNSVNGKANQGETKKRSFGNIHLNTWDKESMNYKVGSLAGDILTDPLMYMTFGTGGVLAKGGTKAAGVSEKSARAGLERVMKQAFGTGYGKDTFGSAGKQVVDDFAQNGAKISESRLKEILEETKGKYITENLGAKPQTNLQNIAAKYAPNETQNITKTNENIQVLQKEQQELMQIIDESNKGQFRLTQQDGQFLYDRLNQIENGMKNAEKGLSEAKIRHKQSGINSIVEQTQQAMKQEDVYNQKLDNFMKEDKTKNTLLGLEDNLNMALRPVKTGNDIRFMGKTVVPEKANPFHYAGKGIKGVVEQSGLGNVLSKTLNRAYGVSDRTQQEAIFKLNDAKLKTQTQQNMVEQAIKEAKVKSSELELAMRHKARPNENPLPESVNKPVQIEDPNTGEMVETTVFNLLNKISDDTYGALRTVYPDLNYHDNYIKGVYKNSEKEMEEIFGQGYGKQDYMSQLKGKTYDNPLDAMDSNPTLKAEENLAKLVMANVEQANNHIARQQLQSWKDGLQNINKGAFNKHDERYLDQFINPKKYEYKPTWLEEKVIHPYNRFNRRALMTLQTGTGMRNMGGSVIHEALDNGFNLFGQAKNFGKGLTAGKRGMTLNGEKIAPHEAKKLLQQSGVKQGFVHDEMQSDILRNGKFGKNPTLGGAAKAVANAPFMPGEFLLKQTEKLGRTPTATRYLDKYGKHGVREALQDTNKVHFNYNLDQSLTNVEKRWLREIMPFYSWTRFSTPFYTQQIAKNPGATNIIANKWTELQGEDDAREGNYNVADYQQGNKLFNPTPEMRKALGLLDDEYINTYANPWTGYQGNVEDPTTLASGINPGIKFIVDSFADKQFGFDRDLNGTQNHIFGQKSGDFLDEKAPWANELLDAEKDENGKWKMSARRSAQFADAFPFLTTHRGALKDELDGDERKQRSRLLGLMTGITTPSVDIDTANYFGQQRAFDEVNKQFEATGIQENENYQEPSTSGPNYDVQTSIREIMNMMETVEKREAEGQSEENPYVATAKLENGQKDNYNTFKFEYSPSGNPIGIRVDLTPYNQRYGLNDWQKKHYAQLQQIVEQGKAQEEINQQAMNQYGKMSYEEMYRAMNNGYYPYSNYSQR